MTPSLKYCSFFFWFTFGFHLIKKEVFIGPIFYEQMNRKSEGEVSR